MIFFYQMLPSIVNAVNTSSQVKHMAQITGLLEDTNITQTLSIITFTAHSGFLYIYPKGHLNLHLLLSLLKNNNLWFCREEVASFSSLDMYQGFLCVSNLNLRMLLIQYP